MVGVFYFFIFIYDMLKRIPKSDISIRPFKAYKEWNFSSGSNEIDLLEANENSSTLSGLYPQNSIYGQLRAQFYNGNEDNPFLRFGSKNNTYEISNSGRDRFLSGSAKVISIPQIYVGEGIKKGSINLLDNGKTYIDDTFGNLIDSAGDTITVVSIDIQDNEIIFTDLASAAYTASFQFMGFDIEDSIFNLTYNGISYDMNIVSFNIESGVMIVENIPFLSGAAGTNSIGNIFYTQGLIVITRALNDVLISNWDLSFKSTKTIYEHEYLLIVNEDEFNVSQNPSAVVTEGGEYTSFVDSSGNTHRVYSKQPVKYIRKKSILENGNTLDYRYTSSVSSSTHFAGFEHYDLSSSIDSTGSFLTPFITTIGLYDDNCDLVAVAKLPQPIKSERDIPVNFIIRFDT
jgi:hypothetical protein